MIGPFDNKYRFLSNFWISDVYYKGVLYKTAEHAFQAAKTLDCEMMEWVRAALTPAEAKKRGRKVIKRDDWEDIRIDVMEEILINKFSKSPLKEMLLETGDEELVEVNWWKDRFWGVCDGVGENNLGKLLMKVRDMLKEESEEDIIICDDDLVVCATGHRPKVFGTYNEKDKIILDVKKTITNFMLGHEISKFISGMAMGVDMWSAEAALELGIPLTVAVPFRGQEKIWPDEVQKRHRNIIKKASEIHVIDKPLTRSFSFEEYEKLPLNDGDYKLLSILFNKRNEWMVNHSDMVMAVWNGEKGGTGNCVNYAKCKTINIFNLWKEEWSVK